MAAPARADTASTQAAQVLFEEGRRLMAAGSLAEACPKLAESQKLDPGAGTLLNLALCYEKSELLASAWVTYTEAAAVADRSGRSEWVKRAREKTAALAPLLSTLTIIVPPDAKVSGLEITRNHHTAGAGEWGVKVPVDGGEHVIEAKATGRETWTTHVSAPARQGALVVTVPVLAQSSAAAPAPATAPVVAGPPVATPTDEGTAKSTGQTQRILGLVTAGVGLAALGVGGYFGLRASSKHDDARSDCNDDETRCGPRGLADYREAVDAANAATIAVTAGAVLLVGGVVLYLTAPRRSASASVLTRMGSLTPLGGTF